MTATLLGTVQAGVHRIAVRAYAQQESDSPVVVLLPAMGVPAGYYEPFVHQLHRRGHTVISFDHRGHGESAPSASPRVRFGYQELVDDLDAVLDLVERAYPRAPRFLLGHSLGGQIAMLYAATRPTRLDGVGLVAAGSVWYRAFRGAGAVCTLIGAQVIVGLTTLLGYWPGHRLGFGGRQPARLMADWARQCRTGRFAPTGADVDYERKLRELRLPVLAVSIEGDPLAPSTAVDDLSGKARHSVRTRRHYTRADAGTDRLDHFVWARGGEPLSWWVDEWVRAHLPERTVDGSRQRSLA